MGRIFRWGLATLIAAAIIGVPSIYFRSAYAHAKRMREVTEGRFYRCGQMTENGFREKLRDFKIKTVINLQDEQPDPKLPTSYWGKPNLRESEVCRQEGAEYILLSWDGRLGLLPRNEATEDNRPQVIDDYLAILDDEKNYPILLHCMAGLHRTGLLTAIYRMEYEGWSKADAMRELKANGFGTKDNTANDYIYEFIKLYRPGERHQRDGKIIKKPVPKKSGNAPTPESSGASTRE